MSVSIETMRQQVDDLIASALEEIQVAASSADLGQIRVKYTGKNGLINPINKSMKDLPKEDKPEVGKLLKKFNESFNTAFQDRLASIQAEELESKLASERVDITLPGKQHKQGVRHLLIQTQEEIEDLFIGMGYQVIEGFEVELDAYNFEKMNLPKNHPARDMQDTFYIDEEVLLRTHTSPVQARSMEAHDFSQGPLKMISPGKVFRRDDDDATHSHQFMQIEGLVVAEQISLADLKGTLLAFARAMFGPDREIRLRPSFFSFTEPSVEVDVSCFKCGGAGCSVCKQSGWIEILGGGVVHPNVLAMSGVDPDKYSGFAFGLGIERVAMLRHNVDDIRHFYQNDLRFLKQFEGGH